MGRLQCARQIAPDSLPLRWKARALSFFSGPSSSLFFFFFFCTMHLSLPADALTASNEVFFKVGKRGPAAKPPTYRSFAMTYDSANGLTLTTSSTVYIPDTELRALLVEHQLEPRDPPCFPTLHRGAPAQFNRFHWNPRDYPGGSKLSFVWKDTTPCKLWVSDYLCYIAVYDLAPGVGERVLGEIVTELLARHKEPPRPAGELTIYTAQRNPVSGEYSWRVLQKRLHRSLETIYLDEAVKTKVVHQLSTFLRSSALYDKYGITWKYVHLFHGKPGGGKSSTILALASKFGRNLAKLTITPDLDSRQVENLFQNVPEQTWLVVEDIVERDGRTKIDFSTFLNCLDGLTTRRGLVVFLTTNFLDKVDAALMRPGRVDCLLEFHLPGIDELRHALRVLAADYAHEHDAFLATCGRDLSIAELQKFLFECVMNKKESILN
jgi:hypothetical protein